MFVVALVASTLCLQAQNFEGTIKWQYTYEVMNADVKELEAMPARLTMKVKGNNVLTKVEDGTGFSGEMLCLGDQKQSYYLYRDDRTYERAVSEKRAKNENAEVTRTSQTRKILNYTCTKYVIEVTEGEETLWQVFWTTTDIKGFELTHPALQELVKNQPGSEKIAGTPLRIELRNTLGNVIIDVAELKQEKLAAAAFVVPADFTEFKRMFNFKANSTGDTLKMKVTH